MTIILNTLVIRKGVSVDILSKERVHAYFGSGIVDQVVDYQKVETIVGLSVGEVLDEENCSLVF